MSKFLNSLNLPFCKGCGHDQIAKHSATALENLGLNPLDVIIVTDIGCHGIIDASFTTHTIHGLHGRSVALGVGVALGKQNENQKIIVFIGDGGVTIGLQHLLEAARLNIDITIIIHNNFLYGMTGGQTSGLTPVGFNTTTSPQGNLFQQYDIIELAHKAGASYTSRIIGIGNYAEKLQDAFKIKGCSVVEVFEVCTGYGTKFNPRRKLTEIVESSGKKEIILQNNRPAFKAEFHQNKESLFSAINFTGIETQNCLKEPLRVILSGSAGEGVQTAASILAKTAINAGYEVTQKGSYPVTVGVGFSTSEMIISPETIHYHGTTVPDVVIITSEDGLKHNLKKIKSMKKGLLLIDSSLAVPDTNATVKTFDFRSFGDKYATLVSLLYFARETGVFDVNYMRNAVLAGYKGEKFPLEKVNAVFNEN